ncbi:hypothetical protein BD770DRAFT_396995 [Pilaira anomala]|nr:hypothetical protein BD770DRAFT_396995 [Pilaira anomala]
MVINDLHVLTSSEKITLYVNTLYFFLQTKKKKKLYNIPFLSCINVTHPTLFFFFLKKKNMQSTFRVIKTLVFSSSIYLFFYMH